MTYNASTGGHHALGKSMEVFFGNQSWCLASVFFLLSSNYSHNYLSLQSLNKHSCPKWGPKMKKAIIDHYSVTRQIRKNVLKVLGS